MLTQKVLSTFQNSVATATFCSITHKQAMQFYCEDSLTKSRRHSPTNQTGLRRCATFSFFFFFFILFLPYFFLSHSCAAKCSSRQIYLCCKLSRTVKQSLKANKIHMHMYSLYTWPTAVTYILVYILKSPSIYAQTIYIFIYSNSYKYRTLVEYIL